MPKILSPLRYPGGKTKFYNYVKSIIENNDMLGNTYIEPFAGGAGLALKLLLNNDMEKIILNDIDISIYSFWYSVLNYTEELCNMIDKVRINVKEWNNQKIIYKEHNKNNLLKLGFSTFFLNRTNMSGVINGGIIGGINQNGNYKISARFNKPDLIEKIIKISREKDRIILSNIDAIDFLKKKNINKYGKIFINLDPPYVQKGSKLYENAYKKNDHEKLSKILSNSNYMWIVTYDVCPLILSLYKNYRASYLDITYNINKKRKEKEYIFFSDNLVISKYIKLLKNKECEYINILDMALCE